MHVPPGIEIRVSAPVYPTESAARVADAIQSVFLDIELADEGARVTGMLADPGLLGDIIQRLRIPDTARGQMYHAKEGARTVLFLNKQAAAAGRFNFAATPGPLGDIRVEVRAPSQGVLDAFIDAAAPDTTIDRYRDPGFPDPDRRADEGANQWRKVPGPWRKAIANLEEE